MMLGSKGLLPPTDAYELLRCKAAPAIFHNLYHTKEPSAKSIASEKNHFSLFCASIRSARSFR